MEVTDYSRMELFILEGLLKDADVGFVNPIQQVVRQDFVLWE
jgi:hypothetical protein